MSAEVLGMLGWPELGELWTYCMTGWPYCVVSGYSRGGAYSCEISPIFSQWKGAMIIAGWRVQGCLVSAWGHNNEKGHFVFQNAQGTSLLGFPWHCDNTAPIPHLDVSTPTRGVHPFQGSGWWRMGAGVNQCLRCSEAICAKSVQRNFVSLPQRIDMRKAQHCSP